MGNELTVQQQNNVVAGFGTSGAFDLLQRQAKLLSVSALVPKEFQNNVANCAIALEMSNRLGANPLMVMQSLYIVHGKPSWSSQFLIAALNSTGRFSPLRYEITGEGDSMSCVAWATEKASGERLESPAVSIGMAKKEGWYSKSGSKWQTMEGLMLRYRAATFFCRLYSPEVTMGFQTSEELADIVDITPESARPAAPTSRKEDLISRFESAPIIGVAEVTSVPEELPITEEEITEATPTESFDLLLEVRELLTELAETQGETADDMLDTLTKGKIGTVADLNGKPDAYLNDIKLMITTALNNLKGA